jgi:hypothetical protein
MNRVPGSKLPGFAQASRFYRSETICEGFCHAFIIHSADTDSAVDVARQKGKVSAISTDKPMNGSDE